MAAKADHLLVIWRHADAGASVDDPERDFRRELSRKGRAQAKRSARWLRAQLPKKFLLISSPAPRALQTARALAEPIIEDALAPGASLDGLLSHNLPTRASTIVLVGHQPQLGLFTLAQWQAGRGKPATAPGESLAIRKSAIWCLKLRDESKSAPLVVAVYDPGFST